MYWKLERERERKLMFEKYSNICVLLFYDILRNLKEEIDLLQIVICIKNSKNVLIRNKYIPFFFGNSGKFKKYRFS